MPINIRISQGHTPPGNPDGITVVIDVIRAFTTAHFAFVGGAQEILLVATAYEALALKQRRPDLLLAGEIDALPIDGFDLGNSPYEVRQTDVRQRTLVQRTTNGVIATLAARNSAQVLVAGLINAEATARWIRDQQPRQVLLVASHPSGDEDVACAQYLCGLLGGDGIPLEEAIQRTRNAHAARKFFQGQHPRLRSDDILMAASSAGDEGTVMQVQYGDQPSVRAVLPGH